MKAVIVVLNLSGGIERIIGPFISGQEAADHSATLEWGIPRMITVLEEPTTLDPCPYTFAHTREWCGRPGCRES